MWEYSGKKNMGKDFHQFYFYTEMMEKVGEMAFLIV